MGSDIFRSGEYVRHFRPEDPSNPFRRLYGRKLHDAVEILGPPRGRAILDVGGGMGRLAVPLARAGWRVVLVDLSEAMIREAGSPLPAAVVADATRLPFRDRSFDAVVALDLLCHLQQPLRGLAEFRRLLSPGGQVLIDSTSRNPLWAFFYPRYGGLSPHKWAVILRTGGLLPGWEGLVHHYREEEFVDMLLSAGLRPQRIIRYGPPMFPKWHLAVARPGEPR